MTQMYKQAHMAATVATPPQPMHPQTPVPSIIQPHSGRTPAPNQHYVQSPAQYPPTTPLQRHASNQGMVYPHPNAQVAFSQQMQQQQQYQMQQQHSRYHPPANPITFTIPETVTQTIPAETAERFMKDANGNMLWFMYPPQDNLAGNAPRGGVGHSVQYLAKRKELEARREKRAKQREEEKEELKRKREDEKEDERNEAKKLMVKALGLLSGTHEV